MNASTRAVAANLLQCAEHEVEEKLALWRSLMEGGGAGASGPTQAAFDALTKRVEAMEGPMKELTTPDIADPANGVANVTGTLTGTGTGA